MKKITTLLLLISFVILINSCKPPEVSPAVLETGGADNPVGSAPPQASTSGSGLPQNILPPEPQELTIQTPQGRTLQARYFPAAVENAPLVILIHWVNANQDDWKVIAAWLQNRGLSISAECAGPGECTWMDPTWFPKMGERSYAVLTFSLSGCEQKDGCRQWTGPIWVEDANAAIGFASKLEGVNPTHIITVGASIGADAAVDSCAWLNQQGGTARCAGTLDISPGSYLGLVYADQVASLVNDSIPVRCLFAFDDRDSNATCSAARGKGYDAVDYIGSAHGMMLIAEDQKPRGSDTNPLEVLLSFLSLCAGE